MDTYQKTARCYGREAYHYMRDMCKHLITHPHPLIVPVYDFQYLNTNKDAGEWRYRYRYTMARLSTLSVDDRHVVNQYCISHAIQPPKEYGKLMRFLRAVSKAGFYHDLHGFNVMQDDGGRFCLVDLEGFISSSHIPHFRPDVKRWWENP